MPPLLFLKEKWGLLKLISFYTKNTIYEKEIEDLSFSCKSLQIDAYIEARKDLGSWEKNCNQKPLFILECLEKFNEPLLWVDADGVLLKKPTLNLGPCDIALYFNNPKHARNGTILINPTQNAKRFLHLWYDTLVKTNLKKPYTPDQPVMNALIREKATPLKIAKLPLAYTQVFDRDKLPLNEVVILHFQASRTAKMDPLFWKGLSGRELKMIRMAVSKKKAMLSE